VLAANPEGLALYAGLADWPASERNTVRYFFRHPAARELFADWATEARGTVANLHSLAAVDPGAPELAALIEELDRGSPEFAELWRDHDIQERRGRPKQFRHPVAGEFTLESEILRFGEDGQRMTVFQAVPGTAGHAALLKLAGTTPAGPGGTH
jgi:hypothetical protein